MKKVVQKTDGNKKAIKANSRQQFKLAKKQLDQKFKLAMEKEKTKQHSVTQKSDAIKAIGSAVAKNVASGSAGVAASKASSALSQNGYQQILNPIIDEQGRDAAGNNAIDPNDGQVLVP